MWRSHTVATRHCYIVMVPQRGIATLWLCCIVPPWLSCIVALPRCHDATVTKEGGESATVYELEVGGVGVCLRQRQGEGREGHPAATTRTAWLAATAPAGPPVIAPAAASGRQPDPLVKPVRTRRCPAHSPVSSRAGHGKGIVHVQDDRAIRADKHPARRRGPQRAGQSTIIPDATKLRPGSTCKP